LTITCSSSPPAYPPFGCLQVPVACSRQQPRDHPATRPGPVTARTARRTVVAGPLPHCPTRAVCLRCHSG
jgi:hypothetical protein